MQLFKTIRLYVRLRRDFVEIINLETGQTVTHRAIPAFSSTRHVIGNFRNAQQAMETALTGLGLPRSFGRPRMKMLIHQLENAEGGLDDIERRALRDIGEMAGAVWVFLAEDPRPLSTTEALSYFER